MLTVHSLTSHDVPICQLNNLSNLASFCIVFRPRTARRCRIERPAHRKIFFSFLECPKKILDSFLNAKTIESWSLEPQIPVWPTIRLEIRERGRRRRAIRAINECRPRGGVIDINPFFKILNGKKIYKWLELEIERKYFRNSIILTQKNARHAAAHVFKNDDRE